VRADNGGKADCVLAMVEAHGPMSTAEIGDVLGVSGSRILQNVEDALHKLVRRSLLAGLHAHIDHKPRSRPVVRTDTSPLLSVSASLVVDAIDRGASTLARLCADVGLSRNNAVYALRRLIASGAVVRVGRGHYATTASQKETA